MSSKLLAIAATLALAASVAQAAEPPVVIPGSAWSTAGTMKAKVSSLPSEELEVGATLEFGPTSDGLVLSGQFRLTVDDGVDTLFTFVGTYDETKPGKPSFDDLGDAVVAAILLVPELQGLEFSSKIKASPKLKDGVETIKLKLKIKAKIPIAIEGFGDSMSVAMGYKGEGTRIVVP